AAGDGPRPARGAGEAGGPAAQHAHARGHARAQAGAHRPGDPRHLRAAGAPAGRVGRQGRAGGPVLRR
ncbi:unnamed protein product, partial [Heterosigma akashiwo]